jgi:hypothetical protein
MLRTLEVLLSRPQLMGMRPVQHAVYRHPGRDPGVRVGAHEFLRGFATQYRHALALLDVVGSGAPGPPQRLEANIEFELARNGWARGRARAVAIAPELEAWAWGPGDLVARTFGLPQAEVEALVELIPKDPETGKPTDPEAALTAVMRHLKRPASSAVFAELAGSVQKAAVDACCDRAFLRFRDTLRGWFPPVA